MSIKNDGMMTMPLLQSVQECRVAAQAAAVTGAEPARFPGQGRAVNTLPTLPTDPWHEPCVVALANREGIWMNG